MMDARSLSRRTAYCTCLVASLSNRNAWRTVCGSDSRQSFQRRAPAGNQSASMSTFASFATCRAIISSLTGTQTTYASRRIRPRHGEVSFQSLLIYLDKPSKGGETFFPAARPSEANQMRLRLRLAPKPGRALCFEQTLEHGSVELREGVKHLMRTDVMHRCLPGTVPPKWITAKRRYLT